MRDWVSGGCNNRASHQLTLRLWKDSGQEWLRYRGRKGKEWVARYQTVGAKHARLEPNGDGNSCSLPAPLDRRKSAMGCFKELHLAWVWRRLDVVRSACAASPAPRPFTLRSNFVLVPAAVGRFRCVRSVSIAAESRQVARRASIKNWPTLASFRREMEKIPGFCAVSGKSGRGGQGW